MSAKVIQLEKPFVMKPYGKGELASHYGVSVYIINKWIKALQPEFGPVIARTVNIKQVQLFLAAYGVPGQVVNEAA